VEEITGLQSRWNGIVHVVDSLSAEMLGGRPFNAKKEWSCSISVIDAIASQDIRWRSLIHEVLHSVSVGNRESSYREFRGWEEGVVEWLQRCYRPDILHRSGVSVPAAIFSEAETRWIYAPAIEALRRLAAQLQDVSELEFFETLLKTPLQDRLSFVQLWGRRGSGDPAEFLRVFTEASGILRR
jgi:hypothetical protein